jgi:ATP-dependent helicase/nuclease subunit A
VTSDFEATQAKQRKASDPSTSVWVSANAGSGKTHVLTQRVVRLLLQGVAPSKILCLTFTKAAAANMAERVFGVLAAWTRLSDKELGKRIRETGAPEPGPADLGLARKLFARTVETPGGLKIQTIHAFCEKLLHHFPFEANVPSRFEVADERDEAELLARARREVLNEAATSGGRLGAALSRVSDECGADDFEKLIREALAHRERLRGAGHVDPEPALRAALGLAAGRTEEAVVREMVTGGLSAERLAEIAEFLEGGSKTDRERAELLRGLSAALRSQAAANEVLSLSLAFFFTDKGEGTPTARLLTNGLAETQTDIAEALRAEQARLEKLREERKSAAACMRTIALVTLVGAILRRYERLKSLRGILDFQDLIERTSVLLERSEAAWVLYKLDAGIDHVLVDEAQDTSAAQWRILDRLTEDFSAGATARRAHKTFFAVGDEKQSIFSFQGAAPHMFAQMRRSFEKRFAAAAMPFEPVALTLSFRSVPGVLQAVDRVFAPPENQKGLVSADIWMPHEALKSGLPGLVELWPPESAKENEPPRDWRLPLDHVDESDPPSKVAGRVADKIHALLAEGSKERVHDSETRGAHRIRPGDIMVLVRKRGPFFEAVIRALKVAGVPVAGADRLVLSRHIAVLDLVAAGRAALLPDDDLTLAAVLKSPLIGLDDDDLMALAPDRPGSLREALAASENPRHARASAQLERWQERTILGPFAFYAQLLGAEGGRRALEGRLGPEAHDAIDEFLALALAQSEEVAPSLVAFLAEVEAMDGSIKRDMETGADSVRVMTVHAAKGLEAKIVFLPDTCSAPSAHHDPKLFEIGDDRILVWSPGKKADTAALAAAREHAREAAEEEYRRLLYVALTRAEERVYIAGFFEKRKPTEVSWSKMISRTLHDCDGAQEVPAFWDPEETILRVVSSGESRADAAAVSRETRAAAPEVPAWLFVPAAPEPASPAPIRPSGFAAPWRSGARTSETAAETGLLAHRLLQILPSLAPEARRRAALAFLAAQGESRRADLAETQVRDLIEAVLGVIAMPELADLFGPGSRAEVSVGGRALLPSGARVAVSGRVDRIAVTDTEVLVADFKTRSRPETIPSDYLMQMALYRAALLPLWPQKHVRMVLIWTSGPSLTWLDDARLDTMLRGLEPGTDAAGSM